MNEWMDERTNKPAMNGPTHEPVNEPTSGQTEPEEKNNEWPCEQTNVRTNRQNEQTWPCFILLKMWSLFPSKWNCFCPAYKPWMTSLVWQNQFLFPLAILCRTGFYQSVLWPQLLMGENLYLASGGPGTILRGHRRHGFCQFGKYCVNLGVMKYVWKLWLSLCKNNRQERGKWWLQRFGCVGLTDLVIGVTIFIGCVGGR